MMRLLLGWSTAIFIALLPWGAEAQAVVCTLGAGSGEYLPQRDQPPSQYALQEGSKIYRLLCPAGCGQITYSQNPTVLNAMTMTLGTGSSKIVYSPDFMDTVFQQFGKAATFGIVAHEVGHHIDLNGNPRSWMDSSWNRELRADALAGCALARASLPQEQLQATLLAIARFPSPSHPAWDLRIPALSTGYQACGGSRSLTDGNGGSVSPQRDKTSAELSVPSGQKGWSFRYEANGKSFESAIFSTKKACDADRQQKRTNGASATPCAEGDEGAAVENVPTATSPDPEAEQRTSCVQKCDREQQRCIERIETMDDCMDNRIARCMRACTGSYGNPVNECEQRLCNPDSGINRSSWRPKCAKKLRRAQEECSSDRDRCADECG